MKVDLTDIPSIKSFVTEQKPDFLIHSAAQRFPDKMQENPEQARLLNVEATKALASSLSKYHIRPLFRDLHRGRILASKTWPLMSLSVMVPSMSLKTRRSVWLKTLNPVLLTLEILHDSILVSSWHFSNLDFFFRRIRRENVIHQYGLRV